MFTKQYWWVKHHQSTAKSLFFFGHVEVGLLKLVKALHSVCDRLFYSLSHKHMHPHIFLGHNLDSDVTGKLPGVQ